jgi:hypothetical protein
MTAGLGPNKSISEKEDIHGHLRSSLSGRVQANDLSCIHLIFGLE